MWQTINPPLLPNSHHLLRFGSCSGCSVDAGAEQPRTESNYQHSACTRREGVEAEGRPGKSPGRMDPSDETTGVTDAGMDGLLLLGRLEAIPIIPTLSAFNCRLLAPNSRKTLGEFMKRVSQLLLLGALILLPVKGVQAETSKDPIYVKTSNGWNAAYARGNEYAEFRVIGNGAKLQDPYHILLQKGVGMMVSFVDKKELQNDGDVLSAHAQWEIDYWHQHASKVESNTREDLTGTRKDVKVTEIRVYNDKGAQMSSYLIGLAAKDGVFVLSVSPAKKDVDPSVKELVSSFKVVPRKLDAEEAKRLSSEAKAQR